MRSVAFDVGTKYSDGFSTSVAVNADGLVVAVEQSTDKSLRQRLGRIDVGAIAFGQPAPYATGSNPSVAVSGSTVVEVHQATSTDLAYHLGAIDKNAVSLGKPQTFDVGTSPVVAINSIGVVVGLQAPVGGQTDLFVRVGRTRRGEGGVMTLDHWGRDDKQLLASRAVDGAIALNDRGSVVVAYRKPGQLLVIMAGQVMGFNIVWGKPFEYGRGMLPALALTNEGIVVEVHLEKRAGLTSACFSNTGQLNAAAKSVDFPSDRNNIVSPVAGFERRCNTISALGPNFNNVAVAANAGLSVQTFSDEKNALGYSASLILNRNTWLSDNMVRVGTKTLRELSLPGSHDATAYIVQSCTEFGQQCNSQTQDSTIFGQLQAGVRYFDIRPVIHNNQLFSAHLGDVGALGSDGLQVVKAVRQGLIAAGVLGILLTAPVDRVQGCLGPPLADVLADVKRFMQQGGGELVILKFSHYQNFDSASDRRNGTFRFDAAQTATLVSAVVEALRDYLYRGSLRVPGDKSSRNGRLANLPLNTLLAGRGVVLPVFDTAGAVFSKQPGTYTYRDYVPQPASSPPAPQTINPNDLPQFNGAELLVYDKFTDNPDLATVSADQLAKLKTPANHGGDLFLFSWTLTQGSLQSLRCDQSDSILTLATTADNALAAAITAEYARGGITRATIPNILYVDRAAGFATDVALWLDERTSLGNTLFAGRRDYLAPNDSLFSTSGRYRLTYLPDGDLVIAHMREDGSVDQDRSIFNGSGRPGWRCIMQEDGNFVIYSQPYDAVFASNTSGHPDARLILTDDGRLTLQDRSGERIPASNLE